MRLCHSIHSVSRPGLGLTDDSGFTAHGRGRVCCLDSRLAGGSPRELAYDHTTRLTSVEYGPEPDVETRRIPRRFTSNFTPHMQGHVIVKRRYNFSLFYPNNKTT